MSDTPSEPDPSASLEAEILEAKILEAEIDAAIALCGGDVHAALRATVLANAYLEAEVERLSEAVSAGFGRGRIRRRPKSGERGMG